MSITRSIHRGKHMYGDTLALSFANRQTSYGQLYDEVASCAGALHTHRGRCRGARQPRVHAAMQCRAAMGARRRHTRHTRTAQHMCGARAVCGATATCTTRDANTRGARRMWCVPAPIGRLPRRAVRNAKRQQRTRGKVGGAKGGATPRHVLGRTMVLWGGASHTTPATACHTEVWPTTPRA